jgi:hypothetical protein
MVGGSCQAREYVESVHRLRPILLAIAGQLAEVGRIVARERGHRLENEYSALIELKPGDHRVIGFRDGGDFYLTNAGPKAKPKVQERDYDLGLRLRALYFEDKIRK